jgi:hypothetical protein
LTPYQPGIEVSYGGVAKNWRGRKHKLFLAMMQTVMQTMPLFAVVKHQNQSGMANKLTRLGFLPDPRLARWNNEDGFVWLPPASPAND